METSGSHLRERENNLDINEELTPEAREVLREEARLMLEVNKRLQFLRAQAALPFRALLLGTTAIITGRVRT